MGNYKMCRHFGKWLTKYVSGFHDLLSQQKARSPEQGFPGSDDASIIIPKWRKDCRRVLETADLSEFVFLLQWHVLCFSADVFRGRASKGSLGWSSSVKDFRFGCFDLFEFSNFPGHAS